MTPDIYDRGWTPARAGARQSVGRALAGLRGPTALATGALGLVGAVLWTIASQAPPVTFQRCVAPERNLAWVGVHLALLRQQPGCSEGQLAINAGPGQFAGLVVIIAAPALVANLFLLLSAVGVGFALRLLLAHAADAVRPLWRRLLDRPALLLPRRRVVPVPPAVDGRPRSWQLDRSPVLRRGPPALLAF